MGKINETNEFVVLFAEQEEIIRAAHIATMLENMITVLPTYSDEKERAIEAYAHKNGAGKRLRHPCRSKSCHYGSDSLWNKQVRAAVREKEEAHKMEEARRVASIASVGDLLTELGELDKRIPEKESELKLAISRTAELRSFLAATDAEIEKRRQAADGLSALLEVEGERRDIEVLLANNGLRIEAASMAMEDNEKELALLSKRIKELEEELPQLRDRAEYLRRLLY